MSLYCCESGGGAGALEEVIVVSSPLADAAGTPADEPLVSEEAEAFLKIITFASAAGWGKEFRAHASLCSTFRGCSLLWEALCQPKVSGHGPSDRTLLHAASSQGNVARVSYLLAHGSRVTQRTRSGMGALCFAAQNGHTETIRLLLSKGASPSEATNDGVLPIHFAAWRGRLEALLALLDHGADLEAMSTTGATALMFAVSVKATHPLYFPPVRPLP